MKSFRPLQAWGMEREPWGRVSFGVVMVWPMVLPLLVMAWGMELAGLVMVLSMALPLLSMK